MILLPLTSDAELRYWPFATGAIIAINVIVFLIQVATPPSYKTVTLPLDQAPGEWAALADNPDLDGAQEFRFEQKVPGYQAFILSHGDGLHPVQWLTSMFMHDGFGHLLGNMIFLWIFGHLVEGAVGPGMFALLYVGMGVAQSMVEQILFLGAWGGGSLGASSAIYALMLVAAWLSPEDNIQCLFIFFFRVFFVEIPVLIFALMYFLFDSYMSYIGGFEMSTPLLHAMGGLLGLIVGFVLLKLQIIDNDGRDLLTSFTGKKIKKPPSKKQTQRVQQAQAEAKLEVERRQQIAHNSLTLHLKAGNFDAAWAQTQSIEKNLPGMTISEPHLISLIQLAQKHQRWPEMIGLSQKYLHLYSQKDTTVRLNLATVLISKESRPKSALRILQGLAGAQLSVQERDRASRLIAAAQRMISEGVIEIGE
jgi:membrane associated rhomboid family serine protease